MPRRSNSSTHLRGSAVTHRRDRLASRPSIVMPRPRRTKPERSAVSDTVSPVKGARLGGLLARGLIGGAAAVIVVVADAPHLAVVGRSGPSPDERRIADLQRLSHAIDAFRAAPARPAGVARAPADRARRSGPHATIPITNRPYDYRPLGPLAYELCARFDAAGPEEPRDFWWHDGGRYCFSLETRDGRRSRRRPPRPAAAPASADPSPRPAPTPSQTVPPPARRRRRRCTCRRHRPRHRCRRRRGRRRAPDAPAAARPQLDERRGGPRRA